MTPAFDIASAAIIAQAEGWQDVVIAQWECVLPYEKPLLALLARGSVVATATGGGGATVRFATTANVDFGADGLAAGTTHDGILAVEGDLVLVKDQASANLNGIYVVPLTGMPVRDTSMDTWDKVPGLLVTVQEGTTQADQVWVCTTDVTGGVLESSLINFDLKSFDWVGVPTASNDPGVDGQFAKDADFLYYFNTATWYRIPGDHLPYVNSSADRTCDAWDAGKVIIHPTADVTARTWTIPAHASVPYPIGTVLTFANENGAGTLTIAITSDTMYLAGLGSTGSRTLLANGIATAIKTANNQWLISGNSLS